MRIALMTIWFMASCGCAFEGSPDSASLNRVDCPVSPEQAFVKTFIEPALRDATRCVAVTAAVGDRLSVRYVAGQECEKMKRHNQNLENVAAPGEHFYRVVRQGSYQLGLSSVSIGPGPKATPGATVCIASSQLTGGPMVHYVSETLLLDSVSGLGYLAGNQMSDKRDSPITAPRLWVHEAGHAAACALSAEGSKTVSVEAENWYLMFQSGHLDRNVPLRMYHDPVERR